MNCATLFQGGVSSFITKLVHSLLTPNKVHFREVSVASQMRGIKSFITKLQNWALSYEAKLIDDYFEHSHYSMGGSVGLKAMEVQESQLGSRFKLLKP